MFYSNIPNEPKKETRDESLIAAIHRKCFTLVKNRESFEELAHPLAKLLYDVFKPETIFICRIKADTLHFIAAEGDLQYLIGSVFPIAESPICTAITENKTLKFTKNAFPKSFADFTQHSDMEVFIEAPLTIDGRPFGTIGMASKNKDYFNESDLELLRDLALFVAMCSDSKIEKQNKAQKKHFAGIAALADKITQNLRAPLIELLRKMAQLRNMLEDENAQLVSILSNAFFHLESIARTTQDLKLLASLCHEEEISLKITQPEPIIENVCDAIRIHAHNIAAVEFKTNKKLPQLNTDPSLLWQIIHAIMLNALEAVKKKNTNELHKIFVFAYQESKNLNIEISDTGCGIKPSIKNSAFDPFVTTKNDPTAGLGLTMAWNHVHALGGQINFIQEKKSKTTVLIQFPIAYHRPCTKIF